MHAATTLLAMVAIVGIVAAFARRYDFSEPLVLVVVGIGCSFIPDFLDVDLTPDLVLFGLLPPLLYSAAIRTSLIDFKANRFAIFVLSIGLVGFTTATVGLAAWWVAPGVTIAAAFALGAVVAPPDAVAATTVARRVGMPRFVVSVLEGESLVNDGSALVALNTAIAAITSTVTAAEVTWDLVRSIVGGVLIGLVVAFLIGQVRKRLDDSVLNTTLSFAAPYIAFLPAEELKSSGVLAVVVCGLLLGHSAPVQLTAPSRVSENINWRTVQFLLENVVFLLIGLQLRRIVQGVIDAHESWTHVVTLCVVVLAVTIAARAAWVFGIQAVLIWFPGANWGWRVCSVVSWAGMRGVVTLAAVFLLPRETPQRALLTLAAFVVVAGTLLIQGLTLPSLVRRLHLPVPDAADDALQRAGLITAAGRAGLDALDGLTTDDDPPEIIAELRQRSRTRNDRVWERLGRAQSELETPGAVYRRLRLQMLSAERGSLLEARETGLYDEEVLSSALGDIDMEESLLDRVGDASREADAQLLTAQPRAGDCEHLRDAPTVVTPNTPEGCEECLRDGTRWVHLRLCLTCGHVGCCDSSVEKHAIRHYHETDHPVMRSFEPGEAWRWCYVDELLG